MRAAVFGTVHDELATSGEFMDCSSDPAAWIAIVISFFALAISGVQAYLSRHESRRTVAMTMYKSYLDLAMANPEFVFASQPPQAPAFFKIVSDPIVRVKYDFYVSSLLLAAESILDVTRNDPEWRLTLKDQLSYHVQYLESPDFETSHYQANLLSLIREAIESYRISNRHLTRRTSAGS